MNIIKQPQFEQQNIQSPLLTRLCAWMCAGVCFDTFFFLFLCFFFSLNKINNISWYILLHWHWTGSDNISIKLINYLSSPIYSGLDTHFVAFFFNINSLFVFSHYFCLYFLVWFLSVFSCRIMFRISVHSHT